MKKFLLNLSLIAVMLCGLSACSNNGTFFSKKILKDNLIPNLPKITCNKAKKQNNKIYYFKTTKEKFNSYAEKIYNYFNTLDFEYFGTRGKKISDFFGGSPTYAFIYGNELSDFLYSENNYVFVWANGIIKDSQNLSNHHLTLTYFSNGIPSDKNYNVSMQLNYTIESYRIVTDN